MNRLHYFSQQPPCEICITFLHHSYNITDAIYKLRVIIVGSELVPSYVAASLHSHMPGQHNESTGNAEAQGGAGIYNRDRGMRE